MIWVLLVELAYSRDIGLYGVRPQNFCCILNLKKSLWNSHNIILTKNHVNIYIFYLEIFYTQIRKEAAYIEIARGFDAGYANMYTLYFLQRISWLGTHEYSMYGLYKYTKQTFISILFFIFIRWDSLSLVFMKKIFYRD